MSSMNSETPFDPVDRLNRDLRHAARELGKGQARYLVDLYYQIQRFRIGSGHQRLQAELGEPGPDPPAEDEPQPTPQPNEFLDWCHTQMHRLENNVKNALGVFARTYTVGIWLDSICGIGPVISAGLLAQVAIDKSPTVGHIWSFAGLNPDRHWERATKRPHSARLKTLCAFKLGESFVKVQNRANDYYGKLYVQRKALEISRNHAGDYRYTADYVLTGRCRRCVEDPGYDPTPWSGPRRQLCWVCHGRPEVTAKRIGKDTQAYEHYAAGRLPPAHIHARARRWAVKLFLAHLHEVMFWDYYQTAPPNPYIFEHQPVGSDHRHKLQVPNWPPRERGKGLREMAE